MIECSLQNVSKSFGANKIFENISFEIKTKEKIGLIGPNGVGKSTLLKILMGKEDHEGMVMFRKGVSPGYLEQIPDYSSAFTGKDVLELAFAKIHAAAKRMEELAHLMAEQHSDDIMAEYSQLLMEYELMGGYDTEEKQSKVVEGLKIDDNMLKTSFDSLSGGEKTKIILGKILLEEPPLLLLDEPSNHLDLSTMEWLEQYIDQYSGAVVIVSHDRYFLDKAVTKIIEMTPKGAYVFHGSYSYFAEEKKRRYDLAMKEYTANQKEIKRVEEQIKRYRIWGAMRDSEKMYAQAKQLERKLEKMDKVEKPVYENQKLKLKARETKRSGKEVLTGVNLSKSFGENLLFSAMDFRAYYRDSIGILGDNGSGKTTLLRILTKELEPDEGNVKYGSNIIIGYISQHIDFEETQKNIMEYFQYKYNITNSDARRELAKVLFTGDDVFKKIDVLSGGEKSRLRLCSLMYEKVNLMILDEPTNHLDIESREILEDILKEYDGTIVFVSHDRYFIAKIAKQINVLENKKMKVYRGDYEYYKSQLQKEQEKLIEAQSEKSRSLPATRTKSEETMRENEIARLKKKVDAMEEEITSIEEILKEIDDTMLEHGDNLEKISELSLSKNALQKELEGKVHAWERLLYELENV